MVKILAIGCFLAACFGPGSIAATTAGSPPTYHFSDCQVGAAQDCVAGSDTNAGTDANRPRRSVAGFNVNALPAGTHLLFARGGAFNHRLQIVNPNATATAPITFADYGSGPLPILHTPSGFGFEFGSFRDTTNDGGYTLRNLVLDGGGTGQWGVWLRGEVHDVTIENVEVRNFTIGIHTSPSGRGVVNLTVRNSSLLRNADHGMLGGAVNLVFENNLIADNNPSGGGFEHGIYLSAGESAPVGSGRIVGNRFLRNSAPNGVCDGGNMTVHGVWDGLLVENNTIEQAAAAFTCFGVSITAAYSTAESFRNVVVRNNTFNNLGACGVCMSAAPGALIEGNKIYNTQPTGQYSILIPAIRPGPGDAADGGAVIRNNVICHSAPAVGSVAVQAPSAASITGNVYQTGAAARTGACAR